MVSETCPVAPVKSGSGTSFVQRVSGDAGWGAAGFLSDTER
jgi:hypothetical protein